jgi:beta-glucosidase
MRTVAERRRPDRPWANRRLPAERRAALLLNAMTLEERVGQMAQYHSTLHGPALEDWIRSGAVGSILFIRSARHANALQRIAVEETRLGVPLIFGEDVIHGFRTIFPIPLAEAAAWDDALAEANAAVAAREARAAGVHWTFAPMVDICRDPRWGRIAEGAGEDPVLGSRIAAARVRGFQGRPASLAAPDRVAATAKHFVGYGAAQGGRDYHTTDLSTRTLEETYLPPFKAAVDAGVTSVMTAFNDLNGMPCTGRADLVTGVLRRRWGFRGFVVSDWNSIGELCIHGVAGTRADAGRLAARAGVDMDMVGDVYRTELAGLVRAGRVPRRVVDEAARRILEVKFRLGLFERPFADEAHEAAACLTPVHLERARDAARRSCVLLRNEGGLLPLAEEGGTIALLGPLAHERAALLGTWACDGLPRRVVTIREGLEAALAGRRRLRHEPGCPVEGGGTEGIARAAAACRDAAVAIVVVGETAEMSGEGGSRSEIGLPGRQAELVHAVLETGVPTVVVLLCGRPLVLSTIAERAPAILLAWHPGIAGGNAVADLLLGRAAPSGRLPATFPRRLGQVPLHYDVRSTGRPPKADDRTTSKYLDAPNTPQWPFGHGLTYTTFGYSNLRVSPARVRHPGTVTIRVDVANEGAREGVETVQLYVRDEVASLTRPVRELKDFAKIRLAPGERRTVTFRLPTAALAFRDARNRLVVEAGSFRVWAAPNAESGLEGSFVLANSGSLEEKGRSSAPL